MRKKTLSWLLIFSIIVNISTIATFSYHRWYKPKNKTYLAQSERHRESLSKKLGLTEEQSAKIRELKTNFWKEIKPLKNELSRERSEFVEILKQDSVNTEEVNRKIDKISEIQRQMQHKTVENLLKHKSILTPEQSEKFISIMTRRMHMDESKRRHSPEFLKE